jgi:hypothetical protein
MYDRITITRSTGDTFDTDSGLHVENTPTIVYAGKGRIVVATPADTKAGERKRPRVSTSVSIPAGITTVIEQRDVVTVTESINSSFQGTSFYVLGEETGTTSLSRRITIQDVQETL